MMLLQFVLCVFEVSNLGATNPHNSDSEGQPEGITCSSSCFCLTASSAVPGIPGSHGIPGLPGPMGPKGEKGSKGAPASQGDLGPEGDRCTTGLPRPKGDRGPSGVRGPTGPSGANGQPGPKGDKGGKGSRGDPGPPGEPGPNVDRGHKVYTPQQQTNTQGTGLVGRKGDKGSEGLKGGSGPEGDSNEGLKGREGLKGDKGERGEPGLSCVSCVTDTEMRNTPTGDTWVPNDHSDNDNIMVGVRPIPGQAAPTIDRPQSTSKLAFTAARSSSVRANAGDVIVFPRGDVITNVGGAFDGDTGVFTSPREGVFYFLFSVCRFAAIKNTAISLMHDGTVVVSVLGGALNGHSDQLTNAATFELGVGDRVWLEVVTDQTTISSNDKRCTSFSGILL